ncbi:MAG: NAD(P)H-quinone oxidoreductase subunit N [Cyanobacteria bacterium J06627_8]
MALITTGKAFIKELEKTGALGVYAPLEGGYEGRYQRRLRNAGYEVLMLSCRGLGDLAAYLFNVHGIRPPHLGKKDVGTDGAVGYRYYIPPVAGYRLEQVSPKSKGLILWLIEGTILSRQELEYLTNLQETDKRISVVVELGGNRVFKWMPLVDAIQAA